VVADDPRPWSAHLPERGGDVDLLAGGSLPAVWAAHAAAEPGRVALIAAEARHTREDLERESRRRAAAFADAGVRPGRRVLFSCASRIEFVLDYLAALRLGAIVVPTNPGCTERELTHIVRDADPLLAVCDDPLRRGWIAAAGVRRVIADAGGGRAAASAPEREPALDTMRPNDPALLMYTSGTTGAPKGALLSHANLLAGVRSVLLAWRWTEADRLALSLPLFHVHGLGVGLHGTLAAGASAILIERFTPEAIVGAVEHEGATLLFSVPTMVKRLADHPDVAALRALRLWVCGSAPLPAALFERVHALTGQRVLERYGMTETVLTVSNPFDGERRPGSIGLPLPGVQTRVEETGELLVKGPSVFGGYWRRPDANREAFAADGCFRTGDVVEHGDDGYFAIVGRTKELIISGGLNVYPREVEEVLAGCPGVREVAVAGTPSEEWGELVTAYVVADADAPPTEQAIGEHLRTRLARYKQPRLIHFVDELPRNSLGKVVRAQLRARSGP
jgi:malonyl-CoA/methylmalonyl-CoA synthetase